MESHISLDASTAPKAVPANVPARDHVLPNAGNPSWITCLTSTLAAGDASHIQSRGSRIGSPGRSGRPATLTSSVAAAANPRTGPQHPPLLTIGTYSGEVRLWSSDGWRSLGGAQIYSTGRVSCIASSPDGTKLAMGGAGWPGDAEVLVCNPADMSVATKLFRPFNSDTSGGAILSLAWQPGGRVLAVGSATWPARAASVHVCLPSDGSVLRTFERARCRPTCLSWSADGGVLAVGSGGWGGDNTIRLWYLTTDRVKTQIQAHDGSVLSVAFSPDGSCLASGSRDGLAKIWKAQDGSLLNTCSGHSGSVDCVAWSPDGSLLATAGQDGAIRVWDKPHSLPAQSPVLVLRGHRNRVTGLAWCGPRSLASGSWDSSVRVWSL